MTLHINLTTYPHIADGDLLRCVPQEVAAYYQALPLAREEGRVTVATPHPDNRTAIRVLAGLLGAEVVPVLAAESAVAAAIERLYPTQALHRQVLSWTDDSSSEATSWRARVQATATLYATSLGLSVTHLASDTRAPALLRQLATTPNALLVCHVSDPALLAELMQATSASLLLVRGETDLPRRVLVALRGFGSDRAALRQARPLLDPTQTAVTVLPLAHGRNWQPDRLLLANDAARLHLDGCLPSLGTGPVAVRLRDGDPAQQLIAELAHAPYDLLVIAAEAWGEFVLQTLTIINAAGVWPNQPVLIVRPPVGSVDGANSRLEAL